MDASLEFERQATLLEEQGDYIQAIILLENALACRQRETAGNPQTDWSLCSRLAQLCNLLAMIWLQEGKLSEAHELLQKAELLTQHDKIGRATTFNNLACYYRRVGQLHAAATSLTQALSLEKEVDNTQNSADTHLNLCAVLSELGRHQSALENCQQAFRLLKDEILSNREAVSIRENTPLDRLAILAVAYHNYGVEQEYMKKPQLALQSYEQGHEIARRHLGSDHGITATLMKAIQGVKKARNKKSELPAITKSRPSAKSTIGQWTPFKQPGTKLSHELLQAVGLMDSGKRDCGPKASSKGTLHSRPLAKNQKAEASEEKRTDAAERNEGSQVADAVPRQDHGPMTTGLVEMMSPRP